MGMGMRTVYKVFAWLIALGVVVQAASMVYGIAGLGVWVDKDGGVLDKAGSEAIFEGDVTFAGVGGLMLHSLNGMMVIPALALIFLVVSFFAKVPGGIAWAALVLGAVILQITLGLLGHSAAIWGGLHGINALALFSLAVYAGMRVPRASAARAETTVAERETV
jgi:hypothetical protein